MASIFILFPKDNAEYVPAALQHFQWAVERFETMSERNRLAAAARGVLHAIHVRLKKALGVSGASVMPSISPSLPHAPGLSSNKETPASSASATSILDPHNSASAAGTSPSLASTSNTRNSSIFTSPGGAGESASLAPSEPFFGGAGGPPIDPSLSGSSNGGNGLAAEQQQQTQQQQATDWALPEGFDWGSIQPLYAMADVAYNDLMGISSSNGADAAAAAAAGGSMPHWAGGAPLLNEAPEGGVADGGGWSFGGDFGNDSVWSVLNQYPTHFPG